MNTKIKENQSTKLIDTHCHINIMVKDGFDLYLTENEISKASTILNEAEEKNVSPIINVGTSLIESINCINLAKKYSKLYASVGIHPNDVKKDEWQNELNEIKKYLKTKDKNKIVAIGECGIDFHYPNYNLTLQKDSFKAQIDLALEYQLPLIIHSRDAFEETLIILDEYKNEKLTGSMHCFSYNQYFADQVIAWGLKLGIGGTITYPKNDVLREVVKKVGLEKIILETDAPFLPPQIIRGKKNHPQYLKNIAEFISELLQVPFINVCSITTSNSKKIFKI